VSQEIQGYFDNLNHLLRMSEKSSQLMHDLEQSNRDMSKFARTLNGELEEEKDEVDEGGMTEAKISEEPKFFKTNNKHPGKS
jgi:light-regulated signal transduction histidine kinase (bacteriophytochrome)